MNDPLVFHEEFLRLERLLWLTNQLALFNPLYVHIFWYFRKWWRILTEKHLSRNEH